MSTFGWIVTAIAIGGATYLVLKNKNVSKSTEAKIGESLRKLREKLISTAEDVDELKMADVVSYFKGKALVKGRDIPFVATIAGFSKIVSLPNKENGFILGVYNESVDELTDVRLIYAKSMDEKFKSVIGNEQLVVLN